MFTPIKLLIHEYNPFVGQAMHYISSTHSNRHEDRTFSHACHSVGGLSGRKYTTYWLNNWDRVVDFKCAPNYVITGNQ